MKVVKNTKLLFVISVLILLGLSGLKLGYDIFSSSKIGGKDVFTEIKIHKGSGLSRITNVLYENKLIKSKKLFKLTAILFGKSKKFKTILGSRLLTNCTFIDSALKFLF